MKMPTKIALLVSSLSLLNACGSNSSKKSDSEVSGSGSQSLRFNLGEYVSQTQSTDSKYVRAGSNGLGVGQATNFLVENNVLVTAENQEISAQYYIDLTVLKKKLPGHVVDLSAAARTGVLEAEVNFRVLGQSVYSMKKSSVMEYNFVRDIGITVPYPILPALSLDLGGKIGGEIGFSVAPGVGKDNRSIAVLFQPKAALQGKVSAGVSVLFARAEAIGLVKLLEAKMPINAGLGFTQNNSPYGLLKFDPLTINVLAGRADLVASLSIGNILPGSAREFWNETFGQGPFGKFEYTYPLVVYKGIPALTLPGKSYQFGT